MTESVTESLIRHQQLYAKDSDLQDYVRHYTGAEIDAFQTLFTLTVGSMQEVTDDIVHAMTSSRPFPFYTESILKYLLWVLNVIPVQVVDMALSK
jgi:hypothetical protein